MALLHLMISQHAWASLIWSARIGSFRNGILCLRFFTVGMPTEYPS